MARSPRLSPAAVRALVVAGILAVLGVVMIVIGWPEEHHWQSWLLQGSWLVFDAAVFVIVWHALRSRRLLPPRTERFRAVWFLMLGGIALGLLLYVIALIARAGIIAPLGQLFIAVGLGAMVCYLAATSLQPIGSSNVEELPELDDLMTSTDDDVPARAVARPRRSLDEPADELS